MISQTNHKHIMAFITFLALIPLVYFIPDWIAPFLPNSKLINVVAAVALIVPVISYVVMPVSQKWLGKLAVK